jgi:glycosyltransferase involved in cell wall biosynthesis
LEMDLSVCLVATEIFGWGRYGGFGSCTRMIGSALAGRGVNVSVVVPLGDGQRPLEELDGVTVHGFPLHRYPSTGQVYRGIDADVYHSEEPSWGTRAALGAVPGRIHIATCQNPRTREDWRLVEGFYPMRRRFFNALFTGELKRAVRQLDAVYCQALYTIRKVREMYDLPYEPGFLPNPVEVPKARASKAEDPTVCFLGRLDGEKRPQLFFELARRFPDIRFVAMGRAHDGGRDRLLRERYSGISNLELVGFKTGPEKLEVLNKSWVLVNTSVSECLPARAPRGRRPRLRHPQLPRPGRLRQPFRPPRERRRSRIGPTRPPRGRFMEGKGGGRQGVRLGGPRGRRGHRHAHRGLQGPACVSPEGPTPPPSS